MLFKPMKRMTLLALLLVASCRSSEPMPDPAGQPVNQPKPADGLEVRDWGDIEKFSGQWVTIEGRFNHIQGTHGIVTHDCGLHVYLPHFDLFRRDDAWGEYVGKRVWVSGLLHTYTKNIPGYQGPSIELGESSGFGVLE